LVAEPFVEGELLCVAHQLLGAPGHLRSAEVSSAADRSGGQTSVGHGSRGSLHHMWLLHMMLLHTWLLHAGLLHSLLLHARVRDVDVHGRVLRLLHCALPVHGGAHNFLPDGLARIDWSLNNTTSATQPGHTLHGAATQLQSTGLQTSLPLNGSISLKNKTRSLRDAPRKNF
jgi:hypothetical protein